MDFSPPLSEARLQRRYKRFLADVYFENGESITVHCPNPGSMLGLAQPGNRVWLSHSSSPRRKFPWSWELVETEGVLVGIHTSKANYLVYEALRERRIPELAAHEEIRQEKRVSDHSRSRIDFFLTGPEAYVEVKSVTMSRESGLAEFPDSKTARGVRHLQELSQLAAQGKRAVLLFVVQRGDCHRFALARDIDPAFYRAVEAGIRAGVEIFCYNCSVSARGIRIERSLPVVIS